MQKSLRRISRTRKLVLRFDDILNIEELASVFHLPNISVETPNINWSRAEKLNLL
jgi:hypothetical protein